MNEVKALLIFCEGTHDVVFVEQIFKRCLAFQKQKWKFSEYPSPFNQLFSKSVQIHAAKDLSLNMAHKFFLPDSIMTKDDRVVLLFNSGGSSQTKQVKLFLKDFLKLLNNASIFTDNKTTGKATSVVAKTDYLFLYDADNVGTTELFNKIQNDFKTIIEQPSWIFDTLYVLDDNPFGAIAKDKAAYIWGENTQSGTLEDMLLPMFKNDKKEVVEKASEFIDSTFIWEINSTNLEHKIAQIAKRKKAIITCTGQNKCSGYSLAVILKDDDNGLLISGLVSEDTFLSNPSVKSFVDFIKKFVAI